MSLPNPFAEIKSVLLEAYQIWHSGKAWDERMDEHYGRGKYSGANGLVGRLGGAMQKAREWVSPEWHTQVEAALHVADTIMNDLPADRVGNEKAAIRERIVKACDELNSHAVRFSASNAKARWAEPKTSTDWRKFFGKGKTAWAKLLKTLKEAREADGGRGTGNEQIRILVTTVERIQATGK